MGLSSREVFNHLAVTSLVICGYYLHLSISAYYLTWRLKPTDFDGLQTFSTCWKTPVLSSVAFFVYKRLATQILAPYF